MWFYSIKDEYLHLWGDEVSCPNWFTREEISDICRGWGIEMEDIMYQLEVNYYES